SSSCALTVPGCGCACIADSPLRRRISPLTSRIPARSGRMLPAGGGGGNGAAKGGSERGLGMERRLRWAIARQYQLPLGTFLGIGALAIVYGGPVIAAQWPILRGIVG